MEAVMRNSSGDYKHRIGNPKRNFGSNRALVSYPSDNQLLTSFLSAGYCGGGGLMSMPPSSLSHSYPPVFGGRQNLQYHRQQPPLLPLPIPLPLNHLNMNISRSNSSSNNNIRLSPPRINKSVKNRGRDHSLTPKKSKNQKKDIKRDERDGDLLPPATTEKKEAPPAEKCSTESSIDEMMGPDPKELPKDVISRVFSSSLNNSCEIVSLPDDKFSGSVVFTPSPPPSSLPLPTFSLRPKLSCKAEAAAAGSGVDAGATDSLRRLLRLR
ncbi:unnamed protein product [Lactuca saligna]|uniref:Uncharacterized protein n=1 Tax=Lactuca saligna TaxID=75948 RepID=A0AA36EHM5_LACSI|nr:unnamed protein product [Lactuca saligna]